MGDKNRARELARAAGVPVSRGTGRLEGTAGDSLLTEADDVGYPLLVKATAGGGGIGMRRVDAAEDLLESVQATSSLAARAFGDGGVYLEHLVGRAHHVEVQVFGFGDGRAVHLYERDCSVQRRHQKVIEEAHSPALRDDQREAIAAVAVRLAQACRYAGAGTVEFLYDADSGEYFFLEMNTRIQVEHAVTEMITGVDLVAAQIRLAMGEDLSEELAQDRIRTSGWAVEARVYAERPAKNFIPSPGLLATLRLPGGRGLRVDAGYREGMKVTPFYDPMLMKVIAHADTRDAAIGRLDQALGELHVEGVETNRDFLRKVLAHEVFRAGQADTAWLTGALGELV